MRLYTVGPVDMYESTLRIGGEPLPYFRTAEFSEVMLSIERDLLALTDAPSGSRAAILTASGTGAMEATVAALFRPGERTLVIDGGSFGHRFAQLCDAHSVAHDDVRLAYPERLTAESLAPFDEPGKYAALLVNIHETSTGQLYDIDMISAFCRRNGCLLVVDAISSFLADPLSVSRSGIDALICSSQKALSLPPGLSFVVLGERVIRERVSVNPSPCQYLSLRDALVDMERGQTPFTPAVGIILQLRDRLTMIGSRGGLGPEIALHAERSRHFRALCGRSGIAVPSFPKSNALTTIEIPDAYGVYLWLKDARSLTVTPAGGALKDRVLRVGHLGNKTLSEYDVLTEALLEAIHARGGAVK